MKTLNFWRTLFCSALAVVAFAACSDDDEKGFSGEPSISVNGATTATVATELAGGDTDPVEVVSAGPWTLSFETAGADTWCTPSVMSGKSGTTSLKFNLGKASAAREATVKLTARGQIAGYDIVREATIVVKQNEGGSVTADTNVAEIRTLLKAMNPGNSKVDVTAEIAAMTITGIVASDFNGHNFGNDYNIAVQDAVAAPNSGLTLNANKFAELALTPGAVVSIPLTGAKVNTFSGVLQIAISNNVTITTAPGDAPDPIVITPDKIFDYESQFVKIENCMPADGVAGTTWSESYNADFVTTSGESFTVYSGKQAAYREQTIPDKSGYVQGIASRSNAYKRVQPRNADDLKGLDQDLPTPDYTVATIAEITKAGNYEVKNASVVALSAKSLVVADASNAFISVYLGATADYAIGDKLTSIKGQVKLNGAGPLQFSSPEVTKSGTQPYTVGAPEVFDGAKVNEWMKNPVTKYVEVEGVLSVTDGKYYNLEINGVSSDYKGGSIDNPTDAQKVAMNALIDKPVIVKGFAISTYSNWFTLMLGEVSGSSDPFISAESPVSFAAAGETKQIAYSAGNLGANNVYAELSGADAAQFSITADPSDGKVSVKALENTTDAAKSATLTLYIAASKDGAKLASATVALKQAAAVSGAGYTMIDKVADLTAGTYFMAGLLDEYSYTVDKQPVTITWKPYSYHLWTGAASGDLETVNYEYANSQLVIDPKVTDGTAATIELVATGTANTYYIKVGDKYLKSTSTNVNRKLALVDATDGAEWLFADFDKGGIVASNNEVYLGTAGAASKLLRSYKTASYANSLKTGLYFFKAN